MNKFTILSPYTTEKKRLNIPQITENSFEITAEMGKIGSKKKLVKMDVMQQKYGNKSTTISQMHEHLFISSNTEYIVNIVLGCSHSLPNSFTIFENPSILSQ